MKKYRVRLSRLALRDLDSVLEWGSGFWGAAEAGESLDGFHTHIKAHLLQMPAAHPLAPESEEFNFDIRQLIYGRYRVLYRYDKNEVLVLRIRGPYTSPAD